MCLSLASPPNRILARPDVRTTLSKKFNDRNGRPMSNDAKVERRHDSLTNAAACASFDASTGGGPKSADA